MAPTRPLAIRGVSRAAPVSALLVTAALLLAACGDDDPATAAVTAADLDGREFVSTRVAGAAMVADTHLSLAFQGGRLAGFAGCNTFTGGYSIDGASLVIAEALAMTRMLCDEPHTAQDAWFADLLNGRPTLVLDGDELTVTGSDITVVFTDPPLAATRLEGTTWRIDQFVVDGVPLDVPDGAVVSFAEDSVNVTSGCNSAFGPVAFGDGTVTVGPLGQTLMLCEGELDAFETTLFGFLQTELAYTADGTVVTVTGGANTLTLQKVPDP